MSTDNLAKKNHYGDETLRVRIRIEGHTKADILEAASRMGVIIAFTKQKRDKYGFYGYGSYECEEE